MSLQYIIDGYNIAHHPLLELKAKKNTDLATALIRFIRSKRLTGSAKNKAILVFDGYPSLESHDYGDSQVSVFFSRKIDADEKIKKLVEESGRRRNIIVVSDDKEIKFMVRFLGARVLGIEEFIRAKDKGIARKQQEPVKPELNYSQIRSINEELRKIWL